MYNNLESETLFIVGGVLLLTIIVPSLISLFVITYHDKVAPRINLANMDSDDLNVYFELRGSSFIYPIEDISRTGLAFKVDRIPESFILEKEMPLKIFLGESEDIKFDLSSKLVYMAADNSNHNYKVGVEFTTPLDNKTLFDIIENRRLTNELSVIEQSQYAIVRGDNVTDLDKEREQMAIALDQSIRAKEMKRDSQQQDSATKYFSSDDDKERLHG